MMDVFITPKKVKGTLLVPASKSVSHRAIIAASLAKGKSVINNIVYSEDITATIEAMEKIGVKFTKNNHQLIVVGSGRVIFNDDNFIDCNESGSTLRFLMPVMALSRQKMVFTGKPGLMKRPMQVYEKLFKEDDFCFVQSEKSIILCGILTPRTFEFPGNISSQFVSGLLFALPMLKGDSTIKLTTHLESKEYVDMTIEVLNSFGVRIEETADGYFVPGNQAYIPTHIEIEADFSQMAFYAVAGIIGGDVTCKKINMASRQPDKRIVDYIRQMGGIVTETGRDLNFKKSKTTGITIDVSQSPDIAPILAVLGALSSGTTIIANAERLKYKETDRLKTTYDTLKAMNVNIEITEDSLIIHGSDTLTGGTFSSCGDHRIAMMIAIAAIRADRSVLIKNADAVKKSYPNFFQDYSLLGGEITVIEE